MYIEKFKYNLQFMQEKFGGINNEDIKNTRRWWYIWWRTRRWRKHRWYWRREWLL